jgi:hypothetical protein
MLTLLDDRMFPLNQLKVEVMIHESIDSIRMFNSVEECVETMVKTIDMFSLGLTMNETLNAFYDAGNRIAPNVLIKRTLLRAIKANAAILANNLKRYSANSNVKE